MRPDLPQAIDEVIARGMAKDPAMRYQGATELAHACATRLASSQTRLERSDPDVLGDGPAQQSGPSAPTIVSE